MRPYSIFQEQKLLLPLLNLQNKTTITQQLAFQKKFVQTEQTLEQKSRVKFSLDKKATISGAKFEDKKTVLASRSSVKTGSLPKQGFIKNSYNSTLKKDHLAEIRDRENFPGFFTYRQENVLDNFQSSKRIRNSTRSCRSLFDQEFRKAFWFKRESDQISSNQQSYAKTNPGLKLDLLNGADSINSPDTSCSKLSLLVGLTDQEKQLSFKNCVAQMVLSFNSFEIRDLNHASNLFQIFLINLTNKLVAYNYFDSDALASHRIHNYLHLNNQNHVLSKSRNKPVIVGLLRLARTLNEPSKVTDVSLPSQLYTVIRSPHVFKKTREQFAITRYKRTFKLNFKSIAALRLLLNSLILLNLPVETKITIKHF